MLYFTLYLYLPTAFGRRPILHPEGTALRQTLTIDPAEITRQLTLCDQVRALLDRRPGPKTAFVDTYGCQQNEADSERLRGYLDRMGYTFTDTE